MIRWEGYCRGDENDRKREGKLYQGTPVHFDFKRRKSFKTVFLDTGTKKTNTLRGSER